MERALLCRPSVFFPEHVCEQADQLVQGLSAQSLGHGTWHRSGMGRMASRHRCLSTKSPGGTEAQVRVRVRGQGSGV